MNQRVHYVKNLDPLKTEKCYNSYPYNLVTLRASKAVESKLGLPYITEVGALIAEAYGEILPTNHSDRHDFIKATIWSYLAYSANEARRTAYERITLRRWTRQGFIADYAGLRSKEKVEAVLNGEIVAGRIVDGQGGLGFALKGKRRYFPLSNQYCVILIRRLKAKVTV